MPKQHLSPNIASGGGAGKRGGAARPSAIAGKRRGAARPSAIAGKRRGAARPSAKAAWRTRRAAKAAASSATRVDPRVRRTRELVIQAFQAELARKGFDALSVRDVVQRAGINRATFYDHFEDKCGLASEVIRRVLEATLQRSGLRTRRLDREALGLLMGIISEVVGGLHAHCKPPYAQVDSLVATHAMAIMKVLFAEWLRSPPAGWRKLSARQRELSAIAASWALYGLALSAVSRAGRASADRTTAGRTTAGRTTAGRASAGRTSAGDFIQAAVPQVASLLGAPRVLVAGRKAEL